jgi:hypothetical protein
MSKMNILGIIKDHFSTFKNYETKKSRPMDYIIFLIVPFLIGLFFVYIHPDLNGGNPNAGTTNALLICASVFTALMLNLLVLVYNLMQKNNNENKEDDKNKEKDGDQVETDDYSEDFIKEIYYNISFSILTSMTLVILLAIYALNIFQQISINGHSYDIYPIISFLIYFLFFLFILTIFMILNRVHILLSDEFTG